MSQRPDQPTADRPAPPIVHRLALRCGAHRWCFTFTDRDAAAVTARLGELARDPDAPLEPEDALRLRRAIDQLPAPPPLPR